MSTKMGDSDEEYERRRARDKFRRERSDYSDRRRGERDDRNSRRDDWNNDRSRRDQGGSNWDRGRSRGGDYNREFERGRRDSAGRHHEMSPPMPKRIRRDWDEPYHAGGGGEFPAFGGGGGNAGGMPHHAAWNHPGGDMTQMPMGGQDARQQRPDIPPPETLPGPAMQTFKQFLNSQPDNIDDMEAVRKYQEYKLDFRKTQMNEFFQQHKDEEWFRMRYHPRDASQRQLELQKSVKKRLSIFLELMKMGLMEDLKLDMEHGDAIIKFLDAVVIKLEGGSDEDLAILDRCPSPPPESRRSRSQSMSHSDSKRDPRSRSKGESRSRSASPSQVKDTKKAEAVPEIAPVSPSSVPLPDAPPPDDNKEKKSGDGKAFSAPESTPEQQQLQQQAQYYQQQQIYYQQQQQEYYARYQEQQTTSADGKEPPAQPDQKPQPSEKKGEEGKKNKRKRHHREPYYYDAMEDESESESESDSEPEPAPPGEEMSSPAEAKGDEELLPPGVEVDAPSAGEGSLVPPGMDTPTTTEASIQLPTSSSAVTATDTPLQQPKPDSGEPAVGSSETENSEVSPGRPLQAQPAASDDAAVDSTQSPDSKPDPKKASDSPDQSEESLMKDRAPVSSEKSEAQQVGSTDNDAGQDSGVSAGKVADNDAGQDSDVSAGNVADNDAGQNSDVSAGKVADNDAGQNSDVSAGKVADNDAGQNSDVSAGKVADNDAGQDSDVSAGKVVDNDAGQDSGVSAGKVADGDVEMALASSSDAVPSNQQEDVEMKPVGEEQVSPLPSTAATPTKEPEEIDSNKLAEKKEVKEEKSPVKPLSTKESKENEAEEKEKDSTEEKMDEDNEKRVEGKAIVPVEPGPRALHKTYSLFMRNIPPNISKADIAGMCKRFPGFLRVALSDPSPDRRFYRRGWITFDRSVNIKEICWDFSNIRIKDAELNPVINRDLSRRVRPVNGITAAKQVVRESIKLAADLIRVLDKKSSVYEKVKGVVIEEANGKDKETSEKKEEGEEGEERPAEEKEVPLNLPEQNPILASLSEDAAEEEEGEEMELLGTASPTQGDATDKSELDLSQDSSLLRVLDRLLLYLRVVHSLDYYNCGDYPHEDEMPNRCGIMHVRGALPDKGALTEAQEWQKNIKQKLEPYMQEKETIPDEEVAKFGKKDAESEIEKYVEANTQELAKDKWLCPISGKKFRGPEFVRKHIFNKHADRVESVRMEAEFFNRFLADPKRPHIPEGVTQKQAGPQTPAGNMGQMYGGQPHGGPGMMGWGPRPPMMMNYGPRAPFTPQPYGGGFGHDGYAGRGHTFPKPRRFGYAAGRNRQQERGGFNRDPRQIVQYRDLDAPEDDPF